MPLFCSVPRRDLLRHDLATRSRHTVSARASHPLLRSGMTRLDSTVQYRPVHISAATAWRALPLVLFALIASLTLLSICVFTFVAPKLSVIRLSDYTHTLVQVRALRPPNLLHVLLKLFSITSVVEVNVNWLLSIPKVN